MNQLGNEPMVKINARIPVDVMAGVELLAKQSHMSISEFIRCALSYAVNNNLQITRNIIYRNGRAV